MSKKDNCSIYIKPIYTYIKMSSGLETTQFIEDPKEDSTQRPMKSLINIAIEHQAGFEYKSFQSFGDLQKFHTELRDSCHYEIIEGKQVLYFDFDGELDMEDLKRAILLLLNAYNVRIDVYSSCDSTKQSYHVLVKGIYFEDHLQCGEFARRVIANSSIKTFDNKVYTSKRNLRLLGSRKLRSTRIKVFHSTLFRSDNFKSRFEENPFIFSLVNDTADCQLIQIIIPKRTFNQSANLSKEEIASAMELLENVQPGVFKERTVEGSMITLTRKKPAFCPICNRIHESDNGIVYKKAGKFYFKCFRGDDPMVLEEEDDNPTFIPIVKELGAPLQPGTTVLVALAEESRIITNREETMSEMELLAKRIVKKYHF